MANKRITHIRKYVVPRTAFKPGDPRINRKGRPKGIPNKVTTDLKRAIINALDRAGGENWFLALARQDRKSFTSLIGRLLPSKIGGEDGKPIELLLHNATTGLSKLTDNELQVLTSLLKKADLDGSNGDPSTPVV